jgi:acyl-coenzyme A synthetase/AMP-(fatty) acid ligase
LTNVRHARERLGLNRSHRVALPVPIFHGFGFGAAFLSCMFGGASVDLQDRSNLLRYLERERQFDPNVAFVTPSFCEILTRGRRAPRRYEFMLTGGDRIGQTAFLRSEAIHGPMISAYGCSEMGFVFCGDLRLSADVRSRTVGRPLPFVEFRVVTEQQAGSGDGLGTLQIRYRYRSEGYVDFGGSALGYDGTLVDDGWYSSADLARSGPDGTVEIIGRQDLSVKRNSMLLPFADLEAALRDLDGVEDAGVAVGPEGIRGRMLVGYCAVRRGPRAVRGAPACGARESGAPVRRAGADPLGAGTAATAERQDRSADASKLGAHRNVPGRRSRLTCVAAVRRRAEGTPVRARRPARTSQPKRYFRCLLMSPTETR